MGGNGAIIVQILGVLLILFFFFLTYMFTKTWRWHHVMFAFMVFPATLTFVVYAALTLKTHAAWQAKYKEFEGKVAEEQTAIERLTRGEAGGEGRSIPSLKAELARMMLDRGRVWRHTTPVGVQGAQIQVNTVPNGEQPKPNQLLPKDQIFVFTEAQSPDGMSLPDVYLGEFRVMSATDNDVTIAPITPLDPVQTAAINQGGATWALYEVMPRDSHYAFAATDPDSDHVFGSPDENQMRAMFRNRYGLPPDIVEENLQRFVRDGTQLQPDDPPTTRWARVEFLANHDVQVDTVSKEGVLDQGYFDSTGRAEDAALWHDTEGKPLSFKKGDIGFFPEEEANRLVDAKIAKIDAPIFVRTLADYDYVFWNIGQRRKELDRAIYLAQRETKSVQETTALAEKTIAVRQEEADKLSEDLEQFVVERDEVQKYRDELSRYWATLQNNANVAYRTNRELERQLQEASQRLTDEINRRTSEVTSTRP